MAWQWPVAIISFIICIWGILPFFTGHIRNVGVWVSCAVGACGVVVAVFKNAVERIAQMLWMHSTMRVIICVCAVLLALLVGLFICVSVVLVVYAHRKSNAATATVLVPGAKLYEDRPSRMLMQRLQTAAAYLQTHPALPCVVSGGQGADEPCAEAVMMRDQLIEMGIDPARIYMENRSVNTFENMQFSYSVIRDNQLPQQVILVTQEFHQYRSYTYAKRAGLSPVASLSCKTPLHLVLCYWVREFAGVCRMWLLGY